MGTNKGFLGTKLVARDAQQPYILHTPNAGRRKIKKKYYIDPREFEADLAEYHASNCPDLLNHICEKYFYPLAKRVVATFGHGYADPEDLVQEGVKACQERIHRYHRANGTPFSFFSIVIKNRGKDIRRSIGRKKSREVPIADYEERFIQC